jgi:hypothetical protein
MPEALILVFPGINFWIITWGESRHLEIRRAVNRGESLTSRTGQAQGTVPTGTFAFGEPGQAQGAVPTG